ncbi:SDR family oxidoreductase [Deefgea rivuli]|uniref:SDR family oxidoreductase n=1 Tax=Deefgea rivuli TaxID=400948 RepID=UPI000485E26C|nr:SDR family oxidoreductase [Deefgea rivuli]
MRILILGGTGLIGSALASQLSSHDVCTLSRSRAPNTIYGDFAQLRSAEVWLPLLDGVDVVVNAVGIFNESPSQTFSDLHVNAPIALFAACEQTSVRVIQVSALGAAPDAVTAYWRSKGQADAVLCASSLNWSIIRPSLIYAANGRSSRALCSIASLLLLADLQGCGDVQPVHLDDVIALLVRLIEAPVAQRQIINVVGPAAMPLSQWWQQLRQAMAMRPAVTIKVLPWMQQLASAMAKYLPSSLLSRDSLAMLRAGNCADVQPFAELLGRAPKAALPAADEAAAIRRTAQLGWMLPMLRIALALVWFLTAAVSLWGWPRDESYALLGEVGIPSSLQALMFYGSVAMDAAFGLACLLNIAWRWQLLLVLFYSVVIAIAMPQFLLHPFGPLLKNVPILALLLMFDQLSNTRQK